MITSLLWFLINTRPRGISRYRVYTNFQNVGDCILENRSENTRPSRIYGVGHNSAWPRVFRFIFQNFEKKVKYFTQIGSDS